jgi:hypothetical protein
MQPAMMSNNNAAANQYAQNPFATETVIRPSGGKNQVPSFI